jgi:hypothetical protein
MCSIVCVLTVLTRVTTDSSNRKVTVISFSQESQLPSDAPTPRASPCLPRIGSGLSLRQRLPKGIFRFFVWAILMSSLAKKPSAASGVAGSPARDVGEKKQQEVDPLAVRRILVSPKGGPSVGETSPLASASGAC